MPGLANSGIKETKEALESAIEEIKELEAENARLKEDLGNVIKTVNAAADPTLLNLILAHKQEELNKVK